MWKNLLFSIITDWQEQGISSPPHWCVGGGGGLKVQFYGAKFSILYRINCPRGICFLGENSLFMVKFSPASVVYIVACGEQDNSIPCFQLRYSTTTWLITVDVALHNMVARLTTALMGYGGFNGPRCHGTSELHHVHVNRLHMYQPFLLEELCCVLEQDSKSLISSA